MARDDSLGKERDSCLIPTSELTVACPRERCRGLKIYRPFTGPTFTGASEVCLIAAGDLGKGVQAIIGSPLPGP